MGRDSRALRARRTGRTVREPACPRERSGLTLRFSPPALAPNPSSKRKASDAIEMDDSENVDPILSSKRSKGLDGFFPSKITSKPSFVLTKANPTPAPPKDVPVAVQAAPRQRALLQPKSPAARLNTAPPLLSAPAGRSPTRGSRRVGILSNRRRTARVDPPSFNIGGAAPFSLDAALQGTIPSYASRDSALLPSSDPSSWCFDIHEDTPEQEMTNLLQHSTCVLDISSDEESEQRARRERAEGRDKENIPPADDVSQTSRAVRGVPGDEMLVEKARDPLSQLNAAEFYAVGCDEASVVIVPGDEVSRPVPGPAEVEVPGPVLATFDFAPSVQVDFDELMSKDEPAAKAAVLAPLEGTGESFDLWESGSAQDEAEPVATPSPPGEAVEC